MQPDFNFNPIMLKKIYERKFPYASGTTRPTTVVQTQTLVRLSNHLFQLRQLQDVTRDIVQFQTLTGQVVAECQTLKDQLTDVRKGGSGNPYLDKIAVDELELNARLALLKEQPLRFDYDYEWKFAIFTSLLHLLTRSPFRETQEVDAILNTILSLYGHFKLSRESQVTLLGHINAALHTHYMDEIQQTGVPSVATGSTSSYPFPRSLDSLNEVAEGLLQSAEHLREEYTAHEIRTRNAHEEALRMHRRADAAFLDSIEQLSIAQLSTDKPVAVAAADAGRDAGGPAASADPHQDAALMMTMQQVYAVASAARSSEIELGKDHSHVQERLATSNRSVEKIQALQRSITQSLADLLAATSARLLPANAQAADACAESVNPVTTTAAAGDADESVAPPPIAELERQLSAATEAGPGCFASWGGVGRANRQSGEGESPFAVDEGASVLPRSETEGTEEKTLQRTNTLVSKLAPSMS